MNDAIDSDFETLRREMEQMRADFAKLSETLRTVVRHGGAAASDKLHDSAERLKDELKRTRQNLSAEIEERPLTVAAIAFLAGMVLGAIFGRRS
jgi:ElaB/YqjD/DUF883 family membrane-anchored ribosome-binding protein